MPYIPEEIIDQIMQKADIVEVAGSFMQLRKKGGDYWGCCPFHKEKTPSFKLNTERQGYYCFGCKEHGDIVKFVKSMVNTDYPGAMHWLADRYGIQIPEVKYTGRNAEEGARLRKLQEKRRNLLEDAAKWFQSLLSTPPAQTARNYLASRGLDQESVSRFMLGYSIDSWDGIIKWGASKGYDLEDLEATGLVVWNDDHTRVYDRFRGRLMFPILNENGKVAGFSARILISDQKSAKYVNSPETDFFQKGQILYGMNLARQSMKDFGYALICEGQLDVISCHRAGLTNAVAAQGTAFTEMHAKLLRKSVNKVVLSFDGDTAGNKAAEKTISLLHGNGMQVSVVTLPAGEDPDSIFRKGGKDALQKVMSVQEDGVAYILKVACQDADITRPEGKSSIVTRVLSIIQPITDLVAKTAYCQDLAKYLDLPESVIISTLNAISSQKERPVLRSEHYYQNNQQTYAKPLPVFSMQKPEDAIWNMLFDLVLHVEEFANELVFMQDVLDMVPQSPVGQAVMQVVNFTESGEWSRAADEISKMDIFNDPEVGKAVMASECRSAFGDSMKDEGAKAFRDCVNRIKILRFSELINQIQNKYSAEMDPAQRRELQEKLGYLIREKNNLRNSMRSNR